MGFQKGRQKTGGRVKGTPNKDNTLKVLLHQHSVDYFTPVIPADMVELPNGVDKDAFLAMNKGKMFSRYENDLMLMKASDRAKCEMDMLQYTTPKMQAISADMSVKDANKDLTDRLTRLAAGEDIQAGE